MQLAIIGLGRMGGNIARRLMRGNHHIVAFDRNSSEIDKLVAEGAIGATSLEDIVTKLPQPRIFWVMLPAGAPTQNTIEALLGLASPGDMVIDGGNTFYKDDVRRAKLAAEKQVAYLDVGTSGGI